jgi:hypothetical protein
MPPVDRRIKPIPSVLRRIDPKTRRAAFRSVRNSGAALADRRPESAARSRSAQRAAPTIPASFRNSAGTILARGFTYLKNLSCFALTPPPMMISSGHRMSSSIPM